MAQLKIVAQTPSIELKVQSKDGSGSSTTLLVGFKRYKAVEAETRSKVYEAIVNTEDFNIMESNEELDNFIKEEILYIKKIALPVMDEDTGEEKVLKIPDTRTAKKVETLWENPAECLDVLLDAYFQWSSWRVSFISAVQIALLDMDYDGAVRKNS